MSEGFCDSALNRYNLILSDLMAELRFLESASMVRPRLGGILNWEALDSEGKGLCRDFMGSKRPESQIAYRGLVVLLSGAFEELVRGIAQESIVTINRIIREFKGVPDQVKDRNVILTGRALAILRSPPDHVVIDSEKLAKCLATCVAESGVYQLNAEVFSMFIKNLTSEHLGDVLLTFGVTLDWDYFGRIGDYEPLFDSKGTRNTAKAVRDGLDRFIKVRNRIAHTADAGLLVDYTEIERQMQFFKVLGRDLVQFVEIGVGKVQAKS